MEKKGPGLAGINEFLKKFCAEIEGLGRDQVTSETEFRNLDLWDSLNALSVLAMIDEEYGVQIPGIQFEKCRNLGELFASIDRLCRTADHR